MKLYSRSFWRTMRSHALAVIQPQPDLRREYRLRRKRLKVGRKWFLFILYFFLGSVALLFNPKFAYIFVAAYGTGTILLRSAAFAGRLRRSSEVSVFAGLPIADNEYFHLQWMKFFRNTFWVFLLAFVAYLPRTQTGNQSSGTAFGFSLLCAIAQWGMVVSAGLAVLNIRKAFWGWAAIALYACALASLILPPEYGHYVYAISFLLPAGWINRAHTLLLADNHAGFLWLLPSVVMSAAAFFLLPRLKNSYHIPLLENVNSLSGRNIGVDDNQAASPDFISQATAARVRQKINASSNWASQGWLERIASAWLNRDEQILAEFMMGGQVAKWSSAWKRGIYIALVGGIVWALVPSLTLLFGIIVIFVSATFSAPVLGGSWPGFSSIYLGMKISFVAALYPVDYWGVSKIILKINTIRLLAWSATFLPLMALLGVRMGFTLQQAEFLGIKLLLLVLVLQFPLLIGLHSIGTNDTRTFTLRAAVLATTGAIYVIGVIFAVSALCLPDASDSSITTAIIMVPCSILFWWLYGLFYSRGRIDLMHDPK